MSANDTIGYVVGGGLKEGFHIRLTVPADSVQEGSFVVCESGRFVYYGLTTDLQLGASDPRFADEQSDRLPAAVQRALYGKTLYTTLAMYPTLMTDLGPDLNAPDRAEWMARVERGEELPGPKPVKTIPAHHAAVRAATEGDVSEIFMTGDKPFVIGYTIEQGYQVGLDLEKLVKRSSGIFGATGTGKSFLTRMVLAGLMQHDVAGALVFDMHNEYGFDSDDSDRNSHVRGLKALFGSKVQVAGLGKDARISGHAPDFTLEIGANAFQVEDILLLGESLNLTETAAVTLGALDRAFGHDWFVQFMKLDPSAGMITDPDTGKKEPAPGSVAFWARQNNVNEEAAKGLYRRLRPIYDKPYIVDKPAVDAVRAIVDQLENGRHVILSFGRYERDEDYLLVSNILTRSIRERWVKKTEDFKGGIASAEKPTPLVIAIEEAHKLLNPAMSNQTSFGTIARELRKYNVTLLIVDQRPSGIDDEVMSQLGTRVTGWLGDEDDIRAVLSGLAGRDQLRGMLARLQEKEEVLLLGWGVKMPIPIRSRRYDEQFYQDVRGSGKGKSTALPDNYGMDDANRDIF